MMWPRPKKPMHGGMSMTEPLDDSGMIAALDF